MHPQCLMPIVGTPTAPFLLPCCPWKDGWAGVEINGRGGCWDESDIFGDSLGLWGAGNRHLTELTPTHTSLPTRTGSPHKHPRRGKWSPTRLNAEMEGTHKERHEIAHRTFLGKHRMNTPTQTCRVSNVRIKPCVHRAHVRAPPQFTNRKKTPRSGV